MAKFSVRYLIDVRLEKRDDGSNVMITDGVCGDACESLAEAAQSAYKAFRTMAGVWPLLEVGVEVCAGYRRKIRAECDCGVPLFEISVAAGSIVNDVEVFDVASKCPDCFLRDKLAHLEPFEEDAHG